MKRFPLGAAAFAIVAIGSTLLVSAHVFAAGEKETFQWHLGELILGPAGGDGTRTIKAYATFFNDSQLTNQTTKCLIRKVVGQEGELGLPMDCDPASKRWWDNAAAASPVVSGGRMDGFSSTTKKAAAMYLSSDFNEHNKALSVEPPAADDAISFGYMDHFVKEKTDDAKAMTIRFAFSLGKNKPESVITLKYKDKDGDWKSAGVSKTVTPDTAGMYSVFQRFSCADTHGLNAFAKKFNFKLCDDTDACSEVFTVPGCGLKIGLFKAAPTETEIAACERFDIGLETEEGTPVKPSSPLPLSLADDLSGTFHNDPFCADAQITAMTLGTHEFLTSVYWSPQGAGWHNVTADFAGTPPGDVVLHTQAQVFVRSSSSSSSSSSESSSSESSWSSSDESSSSNFSSASSSYDSSYSSDDSSSSSYESSDYSSSSSETSSYGSDYSSSSSEESSYSSEYSSSSSDDGSYSSDSSSYSSYCGYGYWSWQWWTNTWEWICDSSSSSDWSSYSSEYSSFSSDDSSYSSDDSSSSYWSSYGNSSF